MSNSSPKPQSGDVVLGGQSPAPLGGVVLGGLEGIKQQMESGNLQQQIEALKSAANYGEAGQELINKVIKEQRGELQWWAFLLLPPHQLREIEVVTVDDYGVINRRETKQVYFFTEDLGNGVMLDMVAIPPGQFMMGSPEYEFERFDKEGPQHQVTIKAFYMGRFEVTQAQWQTVMGNNPSRFKRENRPVETISWNDAQEFCTRISQKTGRRIYRLPSEAEWEYACRAGTTTPFYFGPTITPDLANYRGNDTYGLGPKGQDRHQTTEMSSFPPNAFGLYDMHGNVWEWCEDAWHNNYNGAPTNGSAWVSGGDSSFRLLRGGSWSLDPRSCRSANRDWTYAVYRDSFIGFRVVCCAPELS
uniref:Sulfatase-modifying factor enzyme-like domain-containing protein n=1 Tax=Cyanothece sp. (strain PCC 7425 / ATCC 29141) TaxID=395961 RepID=B8HWI9_CYAP4